MEVYKIVLSKQANFEIDELYHFITLECKNFLTAKRYIRGLRDTINSLANSAEIYQIQTHRSLLQYGANVRRINYRKMTVIYTVHDNTVYIHRVIAASMVSSIF